ncbi:MAG: LPS export ABC transporter periplasmic protein LptC [Muribaculaceae bacterium]|nr:LPS export ABC transporter periplasmic protein LptC [Muribaculaceae bacterium]
MSSRRGVEKNSLLLTKRVLVSSLIVLMLIGVSSLVHQAYAQVQAKKKTQAKKEEVYTRPEPTRPIRPEIPTANRNQQDKVFLEYADELYTDEFLNKGHQVVRGNVKFRKGGMYMYCDSAYFYPETNSIDAFGNVKMEQGDTLFVFSDLLYYNGERQMARLRTNSRRKVRLINRDVTLTTDSLNYDMMTELGYFLDGGEIDDKKNRLSSIHGQYSPRTKDAEFNDDVLLENNEDGYTLETNRLLYNTDTHIAKIVDNTLIKSENDTIYCKKGWYNTNTDEAQLHSRSTIIHADSLNNVTTLEGDSIIYDKATGISRAYMFRDRNKDAQPMVLTDTANKTILIGGFGLFNDKTKESFATDYPLLIEHSRPDTIFLRADTIRTFTYNYGKKLVEPVLTDSMGQPLDSLSQAMAIAEADSLNKETEYHIAKAYRRARFFRNDMQGVADSMTYISRDSMMYLSCRPIIWSGERQVNGNQINIHFNDTTVDWAELPDFGMMAEAVEEEFYNQMSGKKMKAYLENQTLRHLYVDGNVQTIFLPMENDSTYNKLVNAESSYMTIDMADGKMDKLKMWPEVTGTVTPLFMIKKNQYYLPDFNWYEAIRPRREWYGDQSRWADDLGDIPDELEQYFANPGGKTSKRQSNTSQQNTQQ